MLFDLFLPDFLLFRKYLKYIIIKNKTNLNYMQWNKFFLVSYIKHKLIGISISYIKRLILVGVGYRAEVNKNFLHLKLGHSHYIFIKIPCQIKVNIVKKNILVFKSSDLYLLSCFVATVKAIMPPEPYKGKGIRFKNEEIYLKEGSKTK